MMGIGPDDKSVTLKGKYKAVLRTQKSEYFGQSSISYTIEVNNKFLVEIQENGYGDINLIIQVVDKFNFEVLPKSGFPFTISFHQGDNSFPWCFFIRNSFIRTNKTNII